MWITRQMKFIFSFYKTINALSLDVALGAMICACFFAKHFMITILPQGIAILGLTVWIIYTVDHLADAKRITHTASMFRHQFHQKYFISLSVVVAIAAWAEFILLFFIREKLFFAGLVVGLLTFIYILFNRWFLYVKELAGALLYCTGIFLPTFTFQQKHFLIFDWIVVVQFFLIVFINLILFSWMDYHQDKNDRHTSLALQIGKEGAGMILKILFLLIFSLTSYTFFVVPRLGLMYLLMVLVLLMLFLFPKYFKKQAKYRFLGDAIFFFPILFL